MTATATKADETKETSTPEQTAEGNPPADDTTPAEEPSRLCNQTDLYPNTDFQNNVAWIEEFKQTNLTPTSGYACHINGLGPNTYKSVDGMSNDGVIRTVLEGLEVLAQRAAQEGTPNSLGHTKAPEDAKKLLAAAKEFATKRVSSIHESQLTANVSFAVGLASKAGIRLTGIPSETLAMASGKGE